MPSMAPHTHVSLGDVFLLVLNICPRGGSTECWGGAVSLHMCHISNSRGTSVSLFPPTPTQGSVCVRSNGSGFLEWSISAAHERPVLRGI